ncbi:DUF2997 domain-containing protein [Aerosakkonema sp. BLCC-F183]|uniref:DUF2997 domain-containing protein n=1 Tax=Aerosakkonema sp. BLCC-F183 TaxID=3342834 RepID=UPI0035BA02D1
MQYYKVEFTIDKNGNVTEKVIASGTNCTAVTKGLEKAMGEVRSQELLPEYNQLVDCTGSETLWSQV